MRLAPLEDPTLPRGQALSQALAKQLSLLFFAVLQKACFAQLAVAAHHYGLLMRRLPEGLLPVSHCTRLSQSFTAGSAALSQYTRSLHSVLHSELHSALHSELHSALRANCTQLLYSSVLFSTLGHCTQLLYSSSTLQYSSVLFSTLVLCTQLLYSWSLHSGLMVCCL